MPQAGAACRIDVGLILPGEPAQRRLVPASGFNALFTHRVRVSSPARTRASILKPGICGGDVTECRPGSVPRGTTAPSRRLTSGLGSALARGPLSVLRGAGR